MAFKFRFPNKSCFSGTNYCCETCIYFCTVDGSCGYKTLETFKLCSTDGLTYTGSNPANGISATATYSPSAGWAVSYSCPGSSGSHGWGAGHDLPLSYEDPSADGWYVALSATPINCAPPDPPNPGSPAIDCTNCIAVTPPIVRPMFVTISGFTFCGANPNGTFLMSGSGSNWSYTSPVLAADPAVCGTCAADPGPCKVQLTVGLTCGAGGGGTSAGYNWSFNWGLEPDKGTLACYVSGSYPFCALPDFRFGSGGDTIDYTLDWGACNFSYDTGHGLKFFF